MPEPIAEAEISFVGLCTFINVGGANRNIVGPSVIFPRTGSQSLGSKEEHFVFLAYKREVVSAEGLTFEPMDEFDVFFFDRSYEVRILGDLTGIPRTLPTFQTVAGIDDYWPRGMKYPWNPDYVPPRYQQPNSEKVVGFVHIGGGTLAGRWITQVEWVFEDEETGHKLRDRFAREALYSLPLDTRSVALEMVSFGHGSAERTVVRFSPAASDATQIPIWLGSCGKDYLVDTLRRNTPDGTATGEHFRALNLVRAVPDNHAEGPVPSPFESVLTPSSLRERWNRGKTGRASRRYRVYRTERGWEKTDDEKKKGDNGHCGPGNGGSNG